MRSFKRWFVMPIPRWYMTFTIIFFFSIISISSYVYNAKVTSNANIQQPFSQGKNDKPEIAFACNVFWGEEYLPQMLETLAANQIKMTFFIGGSWAKRNPEALSQISSHGHEIANHSYSHPHPNRLSKQENQEQIVKAEAIISEVTGQKTQLYAPPYGEYNDTVLLAAQELGYTTIMWSIDTIDWQKPPVEVLRNRVMKKLHNGAIVLMHPTAPTSAALPQLIQEIRQKGYTITTVSSIIR